MADKKKIDSTQIDALYQWLSYDLQKTKEDLMNELKLSSTQIGFLYKGIKETRDTSSDAMAQEIRYSYKQNQNIYDGLANLLKKDVVEKLTTVEEKLAALEQLQAVLNELSDLKYNYMQLQALYETLSSTLSGEVLAKVEAAEENLSAQSQEILTALADAGVSKEEIQTIVEEGCNGVSAYAQQILDTVVSKEDLQELVENTVNVHSQQVLDAVAAIPAAENVDYSRISDEVGDKFLELLNELKAVESKVENKEPQEVKIDYDKVAGDTAAKVVESMPYVEPVDYNRIQAMVEENKEEPVDYERIQTMIAEHKEDPVDYDRIQEIAAAQKSEPVDTNALVAALMAGVNSAAIASAITAALDVDAIADAVASKIVIPEVDYDVLSDLVIEKLAAKGISADIVLDNEGVAKLADTVAERVAVAENVDYEQIAAIVDEKLANSNAELEKVVTLDDEGIDKIVNGVAEELRNMTLVCEYTEAPVEETVEEVVEETPVEEIVEEVVEEVVETPVEETVEEVVEEAPVVEEPVVVAPVAEELAVATEHVYEEDLDGQLIDAETGLVVRLKRSFTAKMKQSEQQVKAYYSDIKNALTSYKRINSNVSWHGDRFNYGRDTVAKMGINGKTLCFYLDLDPNDPELKTTVYHQKNVGEQKAYESTPFMVKIKSDAAAKKALRLVEVLANKLGAVHDDNFQEVDYVAEYAYASTKRLFEDGDIKATKEKKVDFNF